MTSFFYYRSLAILIAPMTACTVINNYGTDGGENGAAADATSSNDGAMDGSSSTIPVDAGSDAPADAAADVATTCNVAITGFTGCGDGGINTCMYSGGVVCNAALNSACVAAVYADAGFSLDCESTAECPTNTICCVDGAEDYEAGCPGTFAPFYVSGCSNHACSAGWRQMCKTDTECASGHCDPVTPTTLPLASGSVFGLCQ